MVLGERQARRAPPQQQLDEKEKAMGPAAPPQSHSPPPRAPQERRDFKASGRARKGGGMFEGAEYRVRPLARKGLFDH